MQEFEYRPNPTTPERQDRRTIATPFDVEVLQRKTKGFAEATPGYACYHNAFLTVFGIMAYRPQQTRETFPKIIMMETRFGEHAYIEYRGKVYNKGVTWPTNRYPNFTLSEIYTYGTDDTLLTLNGAVRNLTDPTTDPLLGYRDILMTLTDNQYSPTTLADFISHTWNSWISK